MRCCAVLSEQVLSSSLKIALVDYKGVNVKLLKLTGKAQTPPATLLQAAATARVTQPLPSSVHMAVGQIMDQ
jgi:hypothetical protein